MQNASPQNTVSQSSDPADSPVWFITGCSTGFGRKLCEAVLKSGARVAATARNPDQIKDLAKFAKSPADQLLILPLDVTKAAQIQSASIHAIEHFGRIDVLVNNAGFGSMGALEEVTPEEIRRVFDTNVFGLIETTRAFIPQFREQKSGLIFMLSSVSGMVALPGASIYASTKFAVEGFSEALAGELSSFGVKVTILEPGAFRTDFAGRSISVAHYKPEYAEALATIRKYYQTISGTQPGDPDALANLMIEIAANPNPPLRVVCGKIAQERVEKKLEQYANERATWGAKGLATDFPS